MHTFALALALAATTACTSARAAAPPPPPTPTDPAALAALARETAVALGLAVPATRDRLELRFEPPPAFPRGTTIIRVVDRDRRRGLRVVIADDAAGPRAIAAWPL